MCSIEGYIVLYVYAAGFCFEVEVSGVDSCCLIIIHLKAYTVFKRGEIMLRISVSLLQVATVKVSDEFVTGSFPTCYIIP